MLAPALILYWVAPTSAEVAGPVKVNKPAAVTKKVGTVKGVKKVVARSDSDDDDRPVGLAAATPSDKTAAPTQVLNGTEIRPTSLDSNAISPDTSVAKNDCPSDADINPQTLGAKPPAQPKPPVTVAPPSEADGDDDGDDEKSAQPVSIIVTAHRLDAALAGVEPSLGASTYSFSNSLVELRPGGETVAISQVLLQAPGVTQQASGQLLVRGQSGLQYRINNVIVPEGFTDLAESLSARMAARIQLITGALPAQYGLQVGGVVNITTQNGVYQQGGQAELYGGSHGEIEPAIEYADSIGGTNIYLSGSYMQNETGLSALDGSASPQHDRTNQLEGFGYFDHVLDDQSRLSLVIGSTNESFQVPHVSNDDAFSNRPSLTTFIRPLNSQGIGHYLSQELRAKEDDSGQYAILSYQRSTDKLTFQVSGFAHASAFIYTPDNVGDLLFTGLSQSIRDKQITAGIQVEGSYQLTTEHTLRAGVLASWDRQTGMFSSTVLPLNPLGQQTSNQPQVIDVASKEASFEASAFVQDEWKVTQDLTLNAGLRFDHVKGTTDGDQISPRLNIVWSAAEGVTVHGGYARYFVPAQDDENAGRTLLLAVTTGAPPSLVSDPLHAESDDYYDIGVEKKTSHLTLGLDAYWRQAENFLGQAPIGQTPLQRAFNYKTGRVRGIELTANYANGPLTFWSSLALAKAEGRQIISNQFAFTEVELAYSNANYTVISQDQTYTASGGASYKIGALRMSTELLYGSGTPRTDLSRTPNGSRMPSYVQVNLSALYRIAGLQGKRLDLKIDIINAFDRRYALSDGTALGGGFPQWGPRRGIFIGAEQSF